MSNTDEIESRLTSLEYRIEDLQRFVTKLKEEVEVLKTKDGYCRVGPPPVSPFPDTNPLPPLSRETRCPKCNMVFYGTVMYSCPHLGCPTGLGPVMMDAKS